MGPEKFIANYQGSRFLRFVLTVNLLCRQEASQFTITFTIQHRRTIFQ